MLRASALLHSLERLLVGLRTQHTDLSFVVGLLRPLRLNFRLQFRHFGFRLCHSQGIRLRLKVGDVMSQLWHLSKPSHFSHHLLRDSEIEVGADSLKHECQFLGLQVVFLS